jgi:hypothetical protein
MANTAIQKIPMKRFATKAGKKFHRSWKLIERCSIRKKENVKETVIKRMSQQKIIHRGAKFFKKKFDIML